MKSMNTLERLIEDNPATPALIPQRVKPVRLDADAVKNAILTAPSESEAVVRIFRMTYPNFDAIKSVNGYPACNRVTWKLICNWFMALTDRLNRDRHVLKHVMPGGAWMNYGFTTTDRNGSIVELPDWQVIPAETTLT